MQGSWKSLGLAALAGLIIGLLVGFLPTHSSNTKFAEQSSTLTQQNNSLQSQLNAERNRLALSNFAVQAGVITAQAEANNYSQAGSSASALFTDLRRYVDGTTDDQTKQQVTEVLGARDRAIAGLAQADPGTKALLQQIFAKLQGLSDFANHR